MELRDEAAGNTVYNEDGKEVVPETEGQQQDPAAAVGGAGGIDEVVMY